MGAAVKLETWDDSNPQPAPQNFCLKKTAGWFWRVGRQQSLSETYVSFPGELRGSMESKEPSRTQSLGNLLPNKQSLICK